METTRLLFGKVTVLGMLAIIHVAYGYSGGAPVGACNSMVPNHGVPAQTDMSTYTIGVPDMYMCGSPITVKLGGTSNFKGFFCQARTGTNSNTRLGAFNIGSNTNIKLGCSDQAVTHTSSDAKTSVEFTWTPSENHGDVYIVCSWVQAKQTYWVKEMSSKIAYKDGSCGNSASHVTSRWYPYVVMALVAIFAL